ncbi:Dolichol-phosphate mannosyltransferase subunit 3, partial [Trichostrongylus colubriformis]
FQAPIYAVLLLGIYAASSVVYGVATFNDCPSAKDELVKEIKEAQEDLRKRKII